MPDFIGNIQVPEIAPSGVFPLTTRFPHGMAREPQIVTHLMANTTANLKIEQWFYLGDGAKRFTVRVPFLREADRIALRHFWEARQGPYQPFTYNAPNDDGLGTTRPTRCASTMHPFPGKCSALPSRAWASRS